MIKRSSEKNIIAMRENTNCLFAYKMNKNEDKKYDQTELRRKVE